MASETSVASPRRAKFWALVPVALLLAMLIGWGIMVGLALDDPGFAVERDYYQKALNWDRRQAQVEQNQKLGWQLDLRAEDSGPDLTWLTASLRDATGAALRGALVRAEAFPVARSAHVTALKFEAARPGEYQATLSNPRPGLWEVRMSARDAGRTFTQTLRLDLPARGLPAQKVRP